MLDQKWYKSFTVWMAIAGQLLTVLVLLGVIDTEQNDALYNLLFALGEVLTLVGIINNPNRNHVAELKFKQAKK